MKKTAFIMVIVLALAMVVNAQTRVEVKAADLPKVISDKVAADYSGFAIQKAAKVTKDNQTTYELVVLKGTEKEKLIYNANGTFVKKEPVAQATAQKSQAKTKQATTTTQAKKVEATSTGSQTQQKTK